jgi:putative protease
MKGIHYCATVVRVYREALDRLFDDPVNYRCRPEWLEELCKISHRGYTTGFFLGPPRDIDHEYHSRYTRSHDIVGIVESSTNGTTFIGVKNRMETGETLEFISRRMEINSHLLVEMNGEKGEALQVAHPNQRIRVKVPFNTAEYDLVRREKK